jgi:cysteine desulfurase
MKIFSLFRKIKKDKNRIYMDYSSATPVSPRVLDAMTPYMNQFFANPSSLYKEGIEVRDIVHASRSDIANILGTEVREIYFTSGATESNNLAILGVVYGYKGQGLPHIITTPIEHSSVLEVCKYLEREGRAEVTYIDIQENGIVDLKSLKNSLKDNTVLVSVMYANNEIGTIQPLNDIAKEIRHYKKTKGRLKDVNTFVKRDLAYPYFHTDAVQAINYLPVNIAGLGVDMMSFNGGKIYGPKGVGVLYKNKNISINSFSSILHGGSQEYGVRAGTENVAGIVGITCALKETRAILDSEFKRLENLQEYFFSEIKNKFPDVIINGDIHKRLPNNINISISNIESDLLVIELDHMGVQVSSKSACKSGDGETSYVIMSLRNKNTGVENIEGSLRFTLGRENKKQDIDYVIRSIKKIIEKNSIWKEKS